MMIILTTIMGWLKTAFEYLKTPTGQRNVLIVALVIVILLWRGCSGGEDEIAQTKYEQNLRALTDSVRTYETKNGELVFEKSALLVDKNELKKLNKDLFDDVKNLKDRVLVISAIKAKIKHDTVFLKPVLDNSSITFNTDSTAISGTFVWADSTIFDKDNYNFIGGTYTIESDTALNLTTKDFAVTNNEIGMSFKTGITENKDNIEIFVQSNYPGFTATSIEGALLDPRESEVIKKFFPPKRWGFGPYVGYGIYVNPEKLTFGHGFQIGVALHYSIIEWRSWKIKKQ